MCQKEVRVLFVLYQFKSLVLVERELYVIRNEGHSVGDGMGYDHVVGGVVVSLCFVDLQTGIGLVMLLMEIGDVEGRVVFYGAQ